MLSLLLWIAAVDRKLHLTACSDESARRAGHLLDLQGLFGNQAGNVGLQQHKPILGNLTLRLYWFSFSVVHIAAVSRTS